MDHPATAGHSVRRSGVEGGMVGALVAFGEPAGLALAAVLTYRAFAFWLPTLPGQWPTGHDGHQGMY